MLLKFIKAQFRQEQDYGLKVNIQIKIISCQERYHIKAPRKIRKKFANFYGQTLQLYQNSQFIINVNIIRTEANQTIVIGNRMKILCTRENIQDRNQTWKNMVQQNDFLKFYWAYCIPSLNQFMVSRKSSDISMNLAQFETLLPKKELTARENYKIYSPIRKKKGLKQWLQQEEGLSIYESSPEDGRDSQSNKKDDKKQQLINLMKVPLRSSRKSYTLKTTSIQTQRFKSKSLFLINSDLNKKKKAKLIKEGKKENKNLEKVFKKCKKRVFSSDHRIFAFSVCLIGIIVGITAGCLSDFVN